MILSVRTALLILFLLPSGLSGQDIHTYVDRDSVRAGDLLQVILVIDRPESMAVDRYPGEEDFPASLFEYRNREIHRLATHRDSLVYSLQFFGVRDTRIPSLPVRFLESGRDTLTLHSTAVPLFFDALVANQDAEYRPMKPIFQFAASIWPWLILLLLLVAAAYALYRLRNRNRTAVPAPAMPIELPPFSDPLDRLERTLVSLDERREGLTEKLMDPFHIDLGDAIRDYIRQVHAIPAMEMTSTEIVNGLRGRSTDRELVRSCSQVLNQADMVKFARFNPSGEQVGSALDAGMRFLQTAKRVDRPVVDQMRNSYEERRNALRKPESGVTEER